MSDEVAVTTEGAPTQETPETVTGTNDSPAQRTFTQEDLDRILSERLAKERAKGEQAAKKAAEAAEQARLAEAGEWKKLAEKAQADLAEAQRQAAEAQQTLMRREVAAKHNLPAPLADRLRGDTPEELEADAKLLLAAMPKPQAPNINSGTGNGRVPTPGTMDEQEKRELAAVLNVNPKYLP